MVAMLPDPHFRDITYRTPGWAGGEGMLRSFKDTISQSRILNESYFSLRGALDDVVERGIRIVVMPGDLTEDGQIADIEAFIALTEHYRRKHGLMFFATFGNHDAYGMTGRHRTKSYIGADGVPVAVASKDDARLFTPGYAEMMERLRDFGFFRQDAFLHWETPFGDSDALAERTYALASQDQRNHCEAIDSSYLVEPVEGLWLLALDSNVYLPRDGQADLRDSSGYIDSKTGKWDSVVRHRPNIVDWIADVRRRASAQGKALLAFSHYAMVATDDPRPGQYAEVDDEAAGGETTALLARTGIGVHFSGHSHVCNIGRWTDGEVSLTDVALPALCSFPPAYRVLRAEPDTIEVTTVPVGQAAGSESLMGAYRREAESTPDLAEAASILAGSADFGDFMGRQLGVAVQRVLAEKHFGPEFFALLPVPLDECLRELGGEAVPGLSDLRLIDALTDWYRLSRGGEMALPHIPAARLPGYAELGRRLADGEGETGAWRNVRRMLVQLGRMAGAPYASAFTL